MNIATLRLPLYPFIPAVIEYIQTEAGITIHDRKAERSLNIAYEYCITKLIQDLSPHNSRDLSIDILIESPRCKKQIQRLHRIDIILSLLKPYIKDATISEINITSQITTADKGIIITIGGKNEG